MPPTNQSVIAGPSRQPPSKAQTKIPPEEEWDDLEMPSGLDTIWDSMEEAKRDVKIFYSTVGNLGRLVMIATSQGCVYTVSVLISATSISVYARARRRGVVMLPHTVPIHVLVQSTTSLSLGIRHGI